VKTIVRRQLVATIVTLLSVIASVSPAEAQLLDRIKKAAGIAQRTAPAVITISAEQEVEIGRGIAATIAGYYGVVQDPELTRYVNLVGLAVASVDPRTDIAYRFAVLDSDDVNALAAPGGYVFVTRGALALMNDEAMLAGVLGHEVGHVNRRHVVKEIRARARTELGLEEITEQINLTGEEYLEQTIQLGTTALFMGLSRGDELEADAYGVEVAAGAGYDPNGLTRFLAALPNAEAERRSLLAKTHPDIDDRLDAINDAIDDLETDDATVTASDRFHNRSAVETPSSGGR
jgi:predicted Zn-dependent protease